MPSIIHSLLPPHLWHEVAEAFPYKLVGRRKRLRRTSFEVRGQLNLRARVSMNSALELRRPAGDPQEIAKPVYLTLPKERS